MTNILEIGRTGEWWRPKAGILMALLFFSALLGKAPLLHTGYILLLSVVTLTGIGICGHILNDWGDLETDTRAQKPNQMHRRSFRTRIFIMTISLVAALAPWYFLPADAISYSLLALEFFLLWAYALPPLRLKRMPYLAVATDAAYAYAIPAILAWRTYSLSFYVSYSSITLPFLFVWMWSAGTRHMLYHQIRDMKYDKRSGLPNITLYHSVYSVNWFVRKLLLPAEAIAGTLFFLSLAKIYPRYVLLFPAFFLYLFRPSWRTGRCYWFADHRVGYYRSDTFYRVGFSVGAIVLMALTIDWKAVGFLVLIAALPGHIMGSRWGSLLREIIARCYDSFRQLRYFFSRLVNYSIYYFRKFLLGWSEERNRGKYYASWLARYRKKQNGTIAIVNLNYDKYTETFVKGHHEQLPFRCEYYYGTPFPLIHAVDGNLISGYPVLQKVKQCYRFMFSQEEEALLIRHFHQKKISLILAEFGTTGALVAPVAAATGIPLIVIFYGYDAWHQQITQENQDKYRFMFDTACCVIGVSQDICQQLARLGCPPDKIRYLPCYLHSDLFAYSDHSSNPPVLLSVGRFAETKAPHLTILAFYEAQKKIPEARLIMIGKDGGGDLYEACHILARGLGIEHKVLFAGIQPHDKVAAFMRQARVFVQHSVTTPLYHDKEGTPVAVMEAMASGLPVVATRHAGIAELIEHNVTGILTEEYDYLSAAHAMIRLCQDDELVRTMGKAAAERIRLNKLISGHIEVLSDIIRQHRLTI